MVKACEASGRKAPDAVNPFMGLAKQGNTASDRPSSLGDPSSPVNAYVITIFNSQKSLPISSASIRKLVRFVLEQKKCSSSLSVYLVGKRKIAQLHKQFFDDPSPTDCITFPHRDGDFLGEIFVCPKVAMEYDPKRPYVETSLYIIHALLHLLGYDDIDKKKRPAMVKEQTRLLKLAQKKQCILATPS